MQHSCSHYNAFRSIPWQTRTYLRTWQHQMTTMKQPFQCNLQPEIQEPHRTTQTNTTTRCRTHRRNQFAHETTPAAPVAQTRYLSSSAAATLHGKTQGLVLRLPPQNIAHATFMQPLQCDLQTPLQETHRTTQTNTTTRCRTQRRNQFAHETTPAAPAAHTRYLSSPAAAILHGKTQGFVLRLPPQLTTCLRHRFPSSPLPIVTTPLPHHFPSSPLPFVTTSLGHHFPSSPPPFFTTSLRHHSPSSSLPFVTTSLRHHSPSSSLPFVTTSLRPLPIVTTSLRHHFPSSSLPFVTTSLRHHSPSSSLPIVTTSLRHHFPSSPLPFVTLHVLSHHPSCKVSHHPSSRSSLNVMYCYVMKSLTPPFIKVKSQCDVLLCHVKSHTTLHQGQVSM